MKEKKYPEIVQEFPWEDTGVTDHDPDVENTCEEYLPNETFGDAREKPMSIGAVGHLIDQMVRDIQHLELELVRVRYKLSFHLTPPYDEYLRMEIFSGMGARYGGDPVYDEYLHLRGFGEYDDAIDTPFHVKRMLRLAKGFDDYPDLYP